MLGLAAESVIGLAAECLGRPRPGYRSHVRGLLGEGEQKAIAEWGHKRELELETDRDQKTENKQERAMMSGGTFERVHESHR